MKGGLMRIMLGMAASFMATAQTLPKDSTKRQAYEMQARRLSAGCCYANPEAGQHFASKGRYHKLKGWKRIQCGLTKKRHK